LSAGAPSSTLFLCKKNTPPNIISHTTVIYKDSTQPYNIRSQDKIKKSPIL